MNVLALATLGSRSPFPDMLDAHMAGLSMGLGVGFCIGCFAAWLVFRVNA